MSDFLERLKRRIKRKQSEEPTGRPEGSRAGEPGTRKTPLTPSLPVIVPPRPKRREVIHVPACPTTQPLAPRSGRHLTTRPPDLPTWDQSQDIALVFAPGGPVAHLLGDGYRPRSGQVRMARLIKRALDEGGHALIEAGTGSGKSFAYLVSLICTGSRAFISTANKTLQDQLWKKDIPALQRIAPCPFMAALLKGRGNYVCQVKLREWGRQLTLPGQGPSVGDVLARLEETPSGDVEELGLFGELRDALTAGRHDCPGSRCPMYGRCYYEQARIRAEESDIVVLNHALLAFNVVLEGKIVEPRDVIVVDEAHEFENYMIGALRLSLEYDQVPAFVGDAVVAHNVDEGMRGEAMRVNRELFTYLAASADQQDEDLPRWAAPSELPLAQTLAGYVGAIRRQLVKRHPPASGFDARRQMVVDWAEQLANEIQSLGRPVPEDAVRYCERSAGKTELSRIVLCQEPVEVAEFLSERLWKATRTVICTSATLTAGKRFDYFCQRTGAPHEDVIQEVIESPFDYPHQALLYTPSGLYPRYDDEENEYVRKLAAEVARLVRASRGRAFVLCTSTRRVRQLFGLLKSRLPYTCYRQGMAPRSRLLDLFRDSADGAVLFATKSFWAGVDIPGEALSLVIIDKLPFVPFQDPVVQRREQRIREAGGHPFLQYALPEAILALKQGVGRLIRTESDRGVMAVLDSRVNTRRYGPQVIASLPRAQRTFRFEDVIAFFVEEE